MLPASTWLRSRNPLVSLIPGQSFVHSVFVTVSMSIATLVLSYWVGTVPLMNTSRTVFAEYGPGSIPL